MMTRRIRCWVGRGFAALGLASVLTLGHCGAGATAPAQRMVVTTCEVGCVTPNVSPPTRLDIMMNAGGTLQAIAQRCADMGGELVGLTCRHVDY